MKYILKYTESLSKIIEIESFSKDYLVDIIDIGFSINVEFFYRGKYILNILSNKEANWSDVSDSIAPFIYLLDNKWSVGGIYFNYYSTFRDKVNKEVIISKYQIQDDIVDFKFSKIKLYVDTTTKI